MKILSKRNRERIVVGTLFLMAIVLFTSFLFTSLFFSKVDSNDIARYSYHSLMDGGKIVIDWPSIRGVEINLGKTVYDNYFDAQFSVKDTYRIDFINDKGAECLYINTNVGVKADQEYQNFLHLIPEYIAESGYRKIIVYPIHGDGIYSFANFKLIQSPDFQSDQAYLDYQIVDFEIPKFELEIAAEDYQQLEDKRKEALSLGILLTESTDFVPVKIKFNGDNYKSEVRLKGDWTDHISTDKWSLRFDIKGGETIMGMKEFSLQRQETRAGIWAYLIHQLYREQGGISLRYLFVDVVINGQYKGVYALEEGFSKLVVEHSLKRESPIIKFNEDYLWERWAYYNSIPRIAYWVNIEPFSVKKTTNSPGLSGYASYGIDLLDRLINNEIDVGDVFDLEMTAKFAAVVDIFASSHGSVWHNFRFYVNPFTGKLEPITFDDSAFSSGMGGNPLFLFQKNTELVNQIMTNQHFLDLYFQKLSELSENLNVFMESHSKAINQFEYTIKRDDNQFVFNVDKLITRNSSIQEQYSNQGLNCYWKEDGDTGYSLYIKNFNQAPTFIDELISRNSSISLKNSVPHLLDYRNPDVSLEVMEFSSQKELNSSDKLVLNYRLLSNGLSYQTDCAKIQFSFFVAGHAYGTPSQDDGIHLPLLKKLEVLNKNDLVEFGVFTGDFLWIPSEDSYAEFFDQIQIFEKPIFATPGNHDEAGAGNDLFKLHFGEKFSSTFVEGSLLFFLDPDDLSWSIPSEQIEFIKQELNKHQVISNVFVFTHQLLWWEENDTRFAGIKPNSLVGKEGSSNFWTEVAPLFEEHENHTYFIAGDVGAFANGSEFSFTQTDNYTFISSGMGGNKRDNLILVYVTQNDVDFELVGLNSGDPYSSNYLRQYTLLGN